MCCDRYRCVALLALVLGTVAVFSELFLGTFKFTELSSADTLQVRLYSDTTPRLFEAEAAAAQQDSGGILESVATTKHLQGCGLQELSREASAKSKGARKEGPFPWIHQVLQTETSVVFSFETRAPLSAFSFEVNHFGCDLDRGYSAAVVVCKLVSEHFAVRSIGHPAHFFQAITPCWSAFMEFPTARRKIVAEKMLTRTQVWLSSWATTLLEKMQAEVISPSAFKRLVHGSCQPVAMMTPPAAGSGWRVTNAYNMPFVHEQDAVSFRRLLIKPAVSRSKPVLRLGILNRKGSRELENTDKLVRAIRADKRYACIELTETHDLGELSPVEQAEWVFAKDIIISPHGQQLISLAFANTCAVVLEIYPRNYLIPGYFLPFVVNLGAVAFGMHNGPGMLQNVSTLGARGKSRSVKMRVNDDILKTLPHLIHAREKCCRQLRARNLTEAAMARCM